MEPVATDGAETSEVKLADAGVSGPALDSPPSAAIPPPLLGVDYYPEQWPRERWPVDAKQMKEAGLMVVRIAEFSWALIEPEEGKYVWEWLDEAIDVLSTNGLQICLCTPTPTPPAWLTARYDCLRVTAAGVRMHPQSRRHVCANNREYVRLAERVSGKMAERYGGRPEVVAWQLDNEYGCHDTVRCVCDHCARAFRTFLQERHGTLEALNAAWGTAFWSQAYGTWDEVLPPLPTPADQNPGLALDFARFSSRTWEDFNARVAAVVRAHSRAPITHNGMIHFTHYDQFSMADPLDFFSWDNYRHAGASPVTVAANHAFIWGAKQRNFWVIEQQAGQVNWGAHNPLLADGQLSLAVVQALAHGADGLLFFRWRQARHGAEMYHSGLLDFAARPTRALAECRALGRQWAGLAGALRGTRPATERVAVLFDYEGHWALEAQPHADALNFRDYGPGGPGREPLLHVAGQPLVAGPPGNAAAVYWLQWYEACWRRGVGCGVLPLRRELPAGLRVAYCANAHVADEALAARLEAFVRGGGALVLGPRAGFKTPHNALPEGPAPGPLAALVGATVREFDTLPAGESVGLHFEGRLGESASLRAGVWLEAWEPAEGPDGAEVLARYECPGPAMAHLHRRPAVVSRRLGTGVVVALGCWAGEALYTALFPLLNLHAGPPAASPALEVARRGGLAFVLNHGPAALRLPASLLAPPPGAVLRLVASDQWGPAATRSRVSHDGAATLGPYGYLVVQMRAPAAA